MSSKLNPKASKKDRPRSSDRLKNKKRDGTPEKSTTPSQDTADENRPSSLNVIWNEEIEKLQIKPEDVEKSHEPKPPAPRKKTPLAQRVSVRRTKPLPSNDKPQILNLVIAKPAREDSPLKPIDYSCYAGPRDIFNGDVSSHSILGSFSDFHHEAVRRGDFPVAETPCVNLDQSDKPSVKYERKQTCSKKQHKVDNKSNALIYWQLKMIERKKQQGFISKLLQKLPEDLVMNQGEKYCQLQETRHLLDKTIPLIDTGKGYRTGSEFWNQEKLLGDDIRGIHMTLTETEKGNIAPVQHTGVPKSVRREKGWTWAEDYHKEVHYPWHKTPYLSSRLKQLQPYINELDPHHPELDGLEVIGNSRPVEVQEKEMENNRSSSHSPQEPTINNQTIDPLSEHPDVCPAPIFGPSIQFAGQPARWTGDSYSFKDEMGIESRVTFEALTNERITSYIQIVNDGTTSIYYDWKKIATDSPFDHVKTSYVQRFYFNNSNGVLLPGETIKFPFVFKSPNAGVFSEQWLFETRPIICGGASLIVTLRGVAVQEDIYEKERRTVEQDLKNKQVCQEIKYLLHELIDGIKTPERCRSPIDAYLTEEETFTRLNLRMCYKYEQVEELKRIHKQLLVLQERDDQDWNLSVNDLKQNILKLSEDEELKEPLMKQVNKVIQEITCLPTKPLKEEMERVTREFVSEAVDNICGYSIHLRHAIGLPEKNFEEGGNEANDKTQKIIEKPKAESKQEKKVAPEKLAKGNKSGKETIKNIEVNGKITPAQKKPPSRMGTITPIGENTATNIPSPSPPSPIQMSNNSIDKRYREQLSCMTYLILGDLVDKLESVYQDIQDNRTLTLK